MEKVKCSARVMDGFHLHQCSFNGVVVREGKWYCKIHDPVRVAEKDKERRKKWDAQSAANEEKWRREAAIKLACEGVSTEVLEKIKVRDLLRGMNE